ncbi:hypothetical protein M427DRAFT_63908 [Gonapodya prolifera JEL478]|uniref:Uncharacterized protein n=1 Tax=Gonapodya prolifera (strain JEL478) TaxID=1344416 RepID=A0A138ZYI5_GONPJ|nr:hypothetical protein M427DRAFT_63908 [Gonapodya prolifera JEL478]|eukprot:KXS09531.1 hypothetical protein M427DRAFT_63908 [Gonapodya prolifera JEL478]
MPPKGASPLPPLRAPKPPMKRSTSNDRASAATEGAVGSSDRLSKDGRSLTDDSKGKTSIGRRDSHMSSISSTTSDRRPVEPEPPLPQDLFEVYKSDLFLLDDAVPLPVYPPYRLRWNNVATRRKPKVADKGEEGRRSYYSDSDDDDENERSNVSNFPVSVKPYFYERPWLKERVREVTSQVTPYANRPTHSQIEQGVAPTVNTPPQAHVEYLILESLLYCITDACFVAHWLRWECPSDMAELMDSLDEDELAPDAFMLYFPNVLKLLEGIVGQMLQCKANEKRKLAEEEGGVAEVTQQEIIEDILFNEPELLPTFRNELFQEWKAGELNRLAKQIQLCWNIVENYINHNSGPDVQAPNPTSSPAPAAAPSTFLRSTPSHLRLSHLPVLYQLADLLTIILHQPIATQRPRWYSSRVFDAAAPPRLGPGTGQDGSAAPTKPAVLLPMGALPLDYELRDALRRFVFLTGEARKWMAVGRPKEERARERRRDRRMKWKEARNRREREQGRAGTPVMGIDVDGWTGLDEGDTWMAGVGLDEGNVDVDGGSNDEEDEEAEDEDPAKEGPKLLTLWYDILLSFQTQVALMDLVHAYMSIRESNSAGLNGSDDAHVNEHDVAGSLTNGLRGSGEGILRRIVAEAFAGPDPDDLEMLDRATDRRVKAHYKYQCAERKKEILSEFGYDVTNSAGQPGPSRSGSVHAHAHPASTSASGTSLSLPLGPIVRLRDRHPYVEFRKGIVAYATNLWDELGGRALKEDQTKNNRLVSESFLLECSYDAINRKPTPWYKFGPHSFTLDVSPAIRRDHQKSMFGDLGWGARGDVDGDVAVGGGPRRRLVPFERNGVKSEPGESEDGRAAEGGKKAKKRMLVESSDEEERRRVEKRVAGSSGGGQKKVGERAL